jgi:hypothetical protein
VLSVRDYVTSSRLLLLNAPTQQRTRLLTFSHMHTRIYVNRLELCPRRVDRLLRPIRTPTVVATIPTHTHTPPFTHTPGPSTAIYASLATTALQRGHPHVPDGAAHQGPWCEDGPVGRGRGRDFRRVRSSVRYRITCAYCSLVHCTILVCAVILCVLCIFALECTAPVVHCAGVYWTAIVHCWFWEVR